MGRALLRYLVGREQHSKSVFATRGDVVIVPRILSRHSYTHNSSSGEYNRSNHDSSLYAHTVRLVTCNSGLISVLCPSSKRMLALPTRTPILLASSATILCANLGCLDSAGFQRLVSEMLSLPGGLQYLGLSLEWQCAAGKPCHYRHPSIEYVQGTTTSLGLKIAPSSSIQSTKK
ncbi:hypothetical protein AUEXF2481DRAFT_574578 [Aureobasidium subglaciale EXF-2481]|uniref:Uncharacterized protein n=1 Tax=Aureobasidium subglaciale (strain EXF-2481) TaxID=1043005 RepID=A0A074XXJ2_AURSE|nr:uncharacterized protein AUEXF2481DRAFT_574578 [Aureobasidium subglaciale EXF-2481]KEQ90303.1 hypothetical protein AUEXF2481DRAFT_574578 [Aureobasidium subglaciale EXF-2481]